MLVHTPLRGSVIQHSQHNVVAHAKSMLVLFLSFCWSSSGTDDDDMEYFIHECGRVLGVNQQLPESSRTAKHILEYVFSRIVEFKKFNQVQCFASAVINLFTFHLRSLLASPHLLPVQQMITKFADN